MGGLKIYFWKEPGRETRLSSIVSQETFPNYIQINMLYGSQGSRVSNVLVTSLEQPLVQSTKVNSEEKIIIVVAVAFPDKHFYFRSQNNLDIWKTWEKSKAFHFFFQRLNTLVYIFFWRCSGVKLDF